MLVHRPTMKSRGSASRFQCGAAQSFTPELVWTRSASAKARSWETGRSTRRKNGLSKGPGVLGDKRRNRPSSRPSSLRQDATAALHQLVDDLFFGKHGEPNQEPGITNRHRAWQPASGERFTDCPSQTSQQDFPSSETIRFDLRCTATPRLN
ncbi:hypothetical protein BGZ61DRAFT_482702 [Ilyonectria robusta]|uniref:uncharacterized protein n=1 Tax=Ilyonectria robusta TaxID=1079257 RepID=UPI001E8E648D|nr:uncharacterized protein BGZ61DRAFT_482702 [Ilyonectria robusta]KAH8672366.1 hypothetical protein BGZ61DRAFT_482702 [Ilyonectria robusta]